MEMSISLCKPEFWIDVEARKKPGSYEAGLQLLNRTRNSNEPGSCEEGATVHQTNLNLTRIFGHWTNGCSTNLEL